MDQPVEGPVGAVAARTDRVAQGVVGVAMLAAFVFRVPWLVPLFVVVLGLGALLGPRANGLHLVFERLIAPRLPQPSGAAEGTVTVATVRAQDALDAIVLAVASLAFVLGIAFVGWILVIAVAVIAIVAATTRIHIADRLRRAL